MDCPECGSFELEDLDKFYFKCLICGNYFQYSYSDIPQEINNQNLKKEYSFEEEIEDTEERYN